MPSPKPAGVPRAAASSRGKTALAVLPTEQATESLVWLKKNLSGTLRYVCLNLKEYGVSVKIPGVLWAHVQVWGQREWGVNRGLVHPSSTHPADVKTEARGQLTGRHCTDLWALHFLEAVSRVPSVISKGRSWPTSPPPKKPEGKADGSKYACESFDAPPSRLGTEFHALNNSCLSNSHLMSRM